MGRNAQWTGDRFQKLLHRVDVQIEPGGRPPPIVGTAGRKGILRVAASLRNVRAADFLILQVRCDRRPEPMFIFPVTKQKNPEFDKSTTAHEM